MARRLRLLDWASEAAAWIIEDDYLSELQLTRRAAPALASLDRAGRVIHIGSFSKTLSPALRLGFVVASAPLASRLAEVAACLAPTPGHLRRTKRLYAARRETLLAALSPHVGNVATAGLAALLPLAVGVPDLAVARRAAEHGLAPAPLSAWYATPECARPGLLLGITTAPQKNLAGACERLGELLASYG